MVTVLAVYHDDDDNGNDGDDDGDDDHSAGAQMAVLAVRDDESAVRGTDTADDVIEVATASAAVYKMQAAMSAVQMTVSAV
eukprot:scaffold173423_cov21-Tisochrysis_lutea.AAC.1